MKGITVRFGRSSGGVQEGDGRAGAHPAALGHLVHADTVLLGAVEVVVAVQAGFDGGLDEGRRDRVAGALVGDRQRPADRVPLRGAALVVLRPEEVGEEVVPGPSGDAPFVVVAVVAADVDHRVDRGGAAEHPAAGQGQAPPVAVRLGRRVDAPVDLGARRASGSRAARGCCRWCRAGRPRAAARRTSGSSESRAASTHPAEPAPTIT